MREGLTCFLVGAAAELLLVDNVAGLSVAEEYRQEHSAETK